MINILTDKGAKMLTVAILTGIEDDLNAALLSGNQKRIEAGYRLLASDWYDTLAMGKGIEQLELFHKRVLARQGAV